MSLRMCIFSEDDDELILNVSDYLQLDDGFDVSNLSYSWSIDKTPEGEDYTWEPIDEENDSQLYINAGTGYYKCTISDNNSNSDSIIFNIRPDGEDDEDYPFNDPDEESPTIKIGETKTVTLSEDSEPVSFCFTPSKSGKYVFYSESDEDLDTIGRIVKWTYDEEENEGFYEEVGYDDDGLGMSFYASFDAEAGVKYYLQAKTYRKPHSTVSFKVSLIEDTIAGISFTPASPIVLIENDKANGYMDDEDGTYHYDFPLEREGNKLTILNKDGSKEVYTYSAGKTAFVNGSKTIMPFTIEFSSDQGERVWQAGNKYEFTISFRYCTCSVPVEIITAAEASRRAAEAKAKADAEAKAKAEALRKAEEAKRQGVYDKALPKVKVSKPAAKKTSITVKWTKLNKKQLKKSKATHYEIWVCPNKGFAKGQTIEKIVKKSKSSVKIKGLNKNTKYFVKVRAIKYVGGVKHVGAWKQKTIKTKKK